MKKNILILIITLISGIQIFSQIETDFAKFIDYPKIKFYNSLKKKNTSLFQGNNEKKKEQLRRASFEREKKLNIAMALVNGAQAQMSILAQTPKADFGIATAIAMAAAAVTTIAQIAAIKAL